MSLALDCVVGPEWSTIAGGISTGHLQAALALPDLWREVALLEKVLYKNFNQHRGAQHFQRLQEVCRLLRLLRSMQLDRRAAELHAALTTAKQRGALPTGGMLSAYGGDRRRLPSYHAAAALLQCLMAACHLVEELAPAVQRASLQLLAQLAHSFFMPLCLTAVAALARIQVLAGQLLLDAVRAYNSVAEVAALLPLDPAATPDVQRGAAAAAVGTAAAAAAGSTAGEPIGGGSKGTSDELPLMLQAERRGGLPQLQCLPCPPGESLAAQAAAACARYAVHAVPAEQHAAGTAVVLEEARPAAGPPAARGRERQRPAVGAAPVLAVLEDRGVPMSREAFAAATASHASPAAAAAAAADAWGDAAGGSDEEDAEAAAAAAGAPPVPTLLGVAEDVAEERRTRSGAVEVASLMDGEARGHIYCRSAVLLGGGRQQARGPQASKQQGPAAGSGVAAPAPAVVARQPAAAAQLAAAAPAAPGAASKPTNPQPAFVAVVPPAPKPSVAAATQAAGAAPMSSATALQPHSKPAFLLVAAQRGRAPAPAAAPTAAGAGMRPAEAASQQAPPGLHPVRLALEGGAGRKRKKPAAAASGAAPAADGPPEAVHKSWEDWLQPLGGSRGPAAHPSSGSSERQQQQQQGKFRRGC